MYSITRKERSLGRDSLPAGEQKDSKPPESEAGAGLKLDFRRARLETVLDHLHKSAGLWIQVKSNVPAEGTMDLCHNEPVSRAEALSLLKKALCQMGCTLIRKGAIFSVIRSEDVKKNCIPLPAL